MSVAQGCEGPSPLALPEFSYASQEVNTLFFLTHYSFVRVVGLFVIKRWTLGEFSVASVGLASPVDAAVSLKNLRSPFPIRFRATRLTAINLI